MNFLLRAFAILMGLCFLALLIGAFFIPGLLKMM